jgi:hypothetical protein
MTGCNQKAAKQAKSEQRKAEGYEGTDIEHERMAWHKKQESWECDEQEMRSHKGLNSRRRLWYSSTAASVILFDMF